MDCCSVVKSCTTLCNPMDCSMPGFPGLYYLPEFDQTLVHWIRDAIQSFHSLSPPSPPALSLSQNQDLFQWISSSYQSPKYWSFLMKANSLEKTLGKIEGRRRRERQRTDGWMASVTQWTWVWPSSRRRWRTGMPGVLQSIGSQRVGHDWVTEQQQQQHSLVLELAAWRL